MMPKKAGTARKVVFRFQIMGLNSCKAEMVCCVTENRERKMGTARKVACKALIFQRDLGVLSTPVFCRGLIETSSPHRKASFPCLLNPGVLPGPTKKQSPRFSHLKAQLCTNWVGPGDDGRARLRIDQAAALGARLTS
jgi:hypothetical protein